MLASKAAQNPWPMKSDPLPLYYRGEMRRVRLAMTPGAASGQRQYLVVFEEIQAGPGPLAGASNPDARLRSIAQLENELLAAEEHLRMVLDERQTTIEELRSFI